MSPRALFALTALNLLLLVSLLVERIQPAFASPGAAEVLRGKGLEIVDAQGRVRASIEIIPRDSTVKMPDGTVGYPETVLLRLSSSIGRPNVKLAATEDGSGMSLGGSSDARNTYMQLMARGATTQLKLTAEGKPDRVIAP